MDIIIKSFNRAYYLERCLRSIYQFVQGQFSIHILDDGTPPVYLEKIKRHFPLVHLHLSPYYNQKVEAIKNHLSEGKAFDQFQIPASFWKQQIAYSSDYFLLLEDDIWLTASISVTDIEEVMQENNMAMLRLFWQGNPALIMGKKKRLADAIEEIVPTLSPLSAAIILNRFKLRSALYRTGMLNGDKLFAMQLPFYTLYTVAAAFFSKAYWMYLWEEEQAHVDESYQLIRAIQWYQKRQGRYAKMVREMASTSYASSATNNFKEINLDMIHFNYHLNQAWLMDKMDVFENFPFDFSSGYVNEILYIGGNAHMYTMWLEWTARFKEQYRRLGCVVE